MSVPSFLFRPPFLCLFPPLHSPCTLPLLLPSSSSLALSSHPLSSLPPPSSFPPTNTPSHPCHPPSHPPHPTRTLSPVLLPSHCCSAARKIGKVPSEVHLLGLGCRHLEHYTPEPDLCRHCSCWGHKEWRCQSATCCRYCAGPHKLAQCLNKIKEGTKIPPWCCNCGDDHNVHSTLCTVRPQLQREPATDEVSQPRLVFRQAPPPETNTWVMKPSFLATAPHLSQPSCPTNGTSTTPAVFPSLLQRAATLPPVSPKTVPQPGATQKLPTTYPTQQLMAVVSALAAKVDNLPATVSGLSNEFVTFKNQQHTVCSGTPTVAPTPSSASGAQRGQGGSDVCRHSLCDPPKKKVNAAGQCAAAAAPSPRMDIPAKSVKGAT
ncbi:hypothetical protein E2C01_066350 [Portunus trituberculatus]|uniref:Nucleic-acid-binding protein from transposon X-element n=1 Tax=Portunus trituberculatus TaxID=210409 RepID=A0A5B7HS36_PORTR|nr:hypothetical protein [Portunus trituberculatus]